jgi:ZIP family zinc transporter
MNDHVFIALLITTIAGLSTGIGGLLSFFTKKTNTKFLSFSLGLSPEL